MPPITSRSTCKPTGGTIEGPCGAPLAAACWGWDFIPDQYGPDWNGDDGSTPMPPAPDGLADLLPGPHHPPLPPRRSPDAGDR
jgi:hypothetical protein